MSPMVTTVEADEYEFPFIYEKVLMDEPDYPEPIKSNVMADVKDEIFDMLTALETDFNLKVDNL